MSELENRWPGPGRTGGSVDDPQPAVVPELGTRSHGAVGDVPQMAGAVGAEQVAGQALLMSEPVADSEVTSRSAARSADTERSALRPVLIWSAVGVVVLAAAVTAVLLLRGDDSAPPSAAPAPTVTSTLPAPAATTDPIDRGEGTALFTAPPGVVRQYVLTTIGLDPAGPEGALEAYELTYAGALAGDDVTFAVQVSQWATVEQATAAADALSVTLLPASSTGQVQAAGATVGAFSLFGEDGPGSASAVWTNGTVVLHASGPAADIRNFYLAFGL